MHTTRRITPTFRHVRILPDGELLTLRITDKQRILLRSPIVPHPEPRLSRQNLWMFGETVRRRALTKGVLRAILGKPPHRPPYHTWLTACHGLAEARWEYVSA